MLFYVENIGNYQWIILTNVAQKLLLQPYATRNIQAEF